MKNNIKEEKFYRIFGIVMILLSVIFGAITYFTRNFSSIAFVYTFICGFILFNKSLKLKKGIVSDELTRKIGYSSYAFSSQIMLLLLGLFLILNRYFNFVSENIEITIVVIMILQILFLFLSYFWYSKNPNKTGL